MPVSSNQYHGEIGSFYNQLTSQIAKLTISLLNVLVNLREKCFDLYYLSSKY